MGFRYPGKGVGLAHVKPPNIKKKNREAGKEYYSYQSSSVVVPSNNLVILLFSTAGHVVGNLQVLFQTLLYHLFFSFPWKPADLGVNKFSLCLFQNFFFFWFYFTTMNPKQISFMVIHGPRLLRLFCHS